LPIDLPRPAAPAPILTGAQRVRAFLDMWLVDHGFIRDIYWNLHEVAPGVWRAAQPGPRQLRRAKKLGIKTVLNLRGKREDCGSYILERQACEALGLKLVDFPIRSRSPLDRETLHAAVRIFDEIEYPVLMHCKSGADRAGFMATLYQFVKGGVPLAEAMKKQLSLAYGHMRQAKTGVIDFFYESYLAANATSPIAFLDWVDGHYDRDKLDASFKESWAWGILVNYILRRE
jgi:protein tyrosine/serine phosphatase